MKQKLSFLLVSCIILTVSFSYAAFPIRKLHTADAISGNPVATNETPADDPALSPGHGRGHSHYHGGHSHMSHHGPSQHWHGISYHYHSHAYHYHAHYHHYHAHYNSSYRGGNNDAYFGGASIVSEVLAPIVLVLFGSVAGIAFGGLGVLFGFLGLIADRWKRIAAIGLILGIIEVAILAALFASFVI